ncbi:hypothetical protein F2Q65_02905 [Thiohalocapsa marina]|uniref:Type 4 fimbrial biogenesis protein PilX N-terminal domain-containing protein n=1 Tax=Thiohalocapsa marina TaxID=424902 RepID=A0A5M8FUJ2_9GAMM|nr:PilX N-terminal domain-containing pilus assembly protein [Thiohalocapsa marina]KAA6187477.1 hypothetical protein F2Q65_02905 [Thiohalocapsa marina]
MKQRSTGAVLIVSLVMLTVLTILGVSAVRMGVTHSRIVGNAQIRMETEQAVKLVFDHWFELGKDQDSPCTGDRTGTESDLCLSLNGRDYRVHLRWLPCDEERDERPPPRGDSKGPYLHVVQGVGWEVAGPGSLDAPEVDMRWGVALDQTVLDCRQTPPSLNTTCVAARFPCD